MAISARHGPRRRLALGNTREWVHGTCSERMKSFERSGWHKIRRSTLLPPSLCRVIQRLKVGAKMYLAYKPSGQAACEHAAQNLQLASRPCPTNLHGCNQKNAFVLLHDTRFQLFHPAHFFSIRFLRDCPRFSSTCSQAILRGWGCHPCHCRFWNICIGINPRKKP